jgi:2-octaprenylphenol hydroxylase
MLKASISDFDLVIVGSGIAGSALACALGDSPLRIAVIEAQALPTAWPSTAADIHTYDARVSALTPASREFLNTIAVWSLIEKARLSPYSRMHVWDAEGTGSIDFNAADVGQPALGHIVENRITIAALLSRLASCSNISVLDAVSLQSLQTGSQTGHAEPAYRYQLALDNGQCLRARLVVGADGANSLIRRLGDFKTREWDYGHLAIVSTVETEKPHQATAWQRFLPQGPLAFLPLSVADSGNAQRFSSIVWSAETAYGEELMALSDEAFCKALGEAFEWRLGAIRQIARRSAFPLRQRHAISYVKPGLALVADAAHTIHPLAGQGINLGLQDVKVLAEELLRACQRGQDIGSLDILNRYQRRRKGDNLAMMAVMEGFKRLFAEPALPVRWLRNTGMRELNAQPLLKRQIIKQAMGL